MKKVFSFAVCFLFCIPLLFSEQIIFSAGSMSGQAGNSSTTTRLEGAAYIQTESMEISADLVELSGKDYTNIKAQGNISGKNLKSHMDFTCDILEYNRETKVAILKGNVHLEDTENDVKADAQLIEYNQETDIAVLQIKIQLTQKDNVCTGAYAVYQKKDQLLVLSGNAQVKQGKDTFRAQQITLDMETQDITLEGNVKGSVTTEGGNKEAQTEETTEVQTGDLSEEQNNTTEKVIDATAEQNTESTSTENSEETPPLFELQSAKTEQKTEVKAENAPSEQKKSGRKSKKKKESENAN